MNTRQLTAIALAVGTLAAGSANAIPVQWSSNGHFYEVVGLRRYVSWTEAQSIANTDGGYLATLTSEAENQFVWDLVLAATAEITAPFNLTRWFWLGGFQQQPVDPLDEPAGAWSWVTGEPWAYTNWSPLLLGRADCPPAGIPAPWDNCQNPARGHADFLHFVRDAPGALWGDVEISQINMTGYVIEYDSDPTPTPAPMPLALIAFGLTLAGIGRHFTRK